MRAFLLAAFLAGIAVSVAAAEEPAQPPAPRPAAPHSVDPGQHVPVVDAGVLVRLCEERLSGDTNDRLLREAELLTQIAGLQAQVQSLRAQLEGARAKDAAAIPVLPGRPHVGE